jgi:hypothetical protein
VIRSGKEAWALIHMTDGAILTVRSQSEFRIATYRYEPGADRGTMRSAIVLTQGALRIITGLIGKKNKSGYALHTPTASLGIRGTDHDTAYVAYDAASGAVRAGTYDQVYSGATVLRSVQGEVQIQNGEVGYADSAGAARPRLLDQEPLFYRTHRVIDARTARRREELQQKIQSAAQVARCG